jgi:hypothetical protein
MASVVDHTRKMTEKSRLTTMIPLMAQRALGTNYENGDMDVELDYLSK